MSENVTILRSEYDRLCAAEKDFADLRAALAVHEQIQGGTEGVVPAAIADRLIDRESLLRFGANTTHCRSLTSRVPPA